MFGLEQSVGNFERSDVSKASVQTLNGEKSYDIDELPNIFQKKRFFIDSGFDRQTRRTLARYVVAYDG